MAEDTTHYYALLAQVVYRPKNESGWSVLPIDGNTNYFAAGMASDSNTLYVAKADLINNYLDDIYCTADSGATWTRLNAKSALEAICGAQGVSIDWMKYTGSTLFIAAHQTSNQFWLIYYDASSNFI